MILSCCVFFLPCCLAMMGGARRASERAQAIVCLFVCTDLPLPYMCRAHVFSSSSHRKKKSSKIYLLPCSATPLGEVLMAYFGLRKASPRGARHARGPFLCGINRNRSTCWLRLSEMCHRNQSSGGSFTTFCAKPASAKCQAKVEPGQSVTHQPIESKSENV